MWPKKIFPGNGPQKNNSGLQGIACTLKDITCLVEAIKTRSSPGHVPSNEYHLLGFLVIYGYLKGVLNAETKKQTYS